MPAKLSLRDGQKTLAAMHGQYHDVTAGGPCPYRWEQCDAFALARLRGVGHTLYVVQTAGYAYRLIDLWAEGPAGGLGVDFHALYAPDSWGDAVLAALGLLMDEPEFAETCHVQPPAAHLPPASLPAATIRCAAPGCPGAAGNGLPPAAHTCALGAGLYPLRPRGGLTL